MDLDTKKLSLLFESISELDARYQEALNIAKQNSQGQVWLIGGFLYKTLLKEIYGHDRGSKDFDFVVEVDGPQALVLPYRWTAETNRFGTSEISSPQGIKLDFIPIKNIRCISERGLEPRIENYLKGAPLNVHSLAYDVFQRKIIGNIGIESLQERVVRVNDLESASYMVGKYPEKYRHLDDLLQKKAKELGFSYEKV